MRILQVIPALPDFMGDSGQVLILAKYFQGLGHYVTIATTDGDPFFNNPENSKRYGPTREKLQNAKGQPVEINGIPVLAVHCTAPRLGMYSFEASKFANKIIKEFDVVHTYSWYHHPGIVFYKAAQKNHVPFFVSMWGTIQPGAHEFRKWEKQLIDFFYTKKMIRHATGLHSIGDSETAELIKWGARSDRIHRIDNGVVLENYLLKKKTGILNRIGVEDKKFLLFLGRINQKKGIELLLKTFVELSKVRKDLMLVIAGSGDADYVGRIKELVRDLQLSESVRFTGLVTEEEKLELLYSAKLFVLTSVDDIHPRAVQDALATGLPVLITKVCDYPEVDEYEAGMTVELNLNAIYHSLLKMLENEERLAVLSQNAKRMIKEKFAMEDQIKKYERLYMATMKQ